MKRPTPSILVARRDAHGGVGALANRLLGSSAHRPVGRVLVDAANRSGAASTVTAVA